MGFRFFFFNFPLFLNFWCFFFTPFAFFLPVCTRLDTHIPSCDKSVICVIRIFSLSEKSPKYDAYNVLCFSSRKGRPTTETPVLRSTTFGVAALRLGLCVATRRFPDCLAGQG